MEVCEGLSSTKNGFILIFHKSAVANETSIGISTCNTSENFIRGLVLMCSNHF
jgi:hypothetical protein